MRGKVIKNICGILFSTIILFPLSEIEAASDSQADTVKVVISPHNVVAGSAQDFTYTFYIVDTSPTASADKFVIHNPFTDKEITVEEILIDGVSQWIQRIATATHPDSGHCYWYYYSSSGSDSLVILAPTSGVLDSLVVTFSEGIPTTTSSSNHFTSYYDDTNTGPYTKCTEKFSGAWDVEVIPGAAHHFTVVTEHSGAETANSSFSLTVTCYDAEGNVKTDYTGNHSITWTWDATTSPAPRSVSPTKPADGVQAFSSGSVTVSGFKLTNAGETPWIKVDAGGGLEGTSALITVNVGTLDYVRVENGPNGTGNEVTTHSMTTEETYTVYAAGYDDCSNYREDVSVSWSSTGTLAPAVSGSGTSVIFDPTSTGSGTIVADHATATDDATGTITVNPGAAHHFTVVTEHNGVETANNSFGLMVTCYDAEGNVKTDYTGNHSITWTWNASTSPLPRSVSPTKPADGVQTFSSGTVTVSGFKLTNAGESPWIKAEAGSG